MRVPKAAKLPLPNEPAPGGGDKASAHTVSQVEAEDTSDDGSVFEDYSAEDVSATYEDVSAAAAAESAAVPSIIPVATTLANPLPSATPSAPAAITAHPPTSTITVHSAAAATSTAISIPTIPFTSPAALPLGTLPAMTAPATSPPIDAEHERFNLKIEGPSLHAPEATGVVATSVASSAATACAAYLEQNWVDGQVSSVAQ